MKDCPGCAAEVKAKNDRYRATINGAYQQRLARWRKTNIDVEAAEAEFQKGKTACDLCGRRGELHIDHDHETGAVRGSLCGPCNRGLGFLQDSPALLRAAIEYLQANGKL